MSKRLVVVAGNIGAGKTSLTERIGSRLGWRTDFESVADNPYLPDFYADMRAWSFHLFFTQATLREQVVERNVFVALQTILWVSRVKFATRPAAGSLAPCGREGQGEGKMSCVHPHTALSLGGRGSQSDPHQSRRNGK